MRQTFIFIVVLVFCASICIISAKENVKLVYDPKFANYISASTIVNKELQSNGFELEVAQAYECKCKNGRCMRVCDVEKSVPCLDQKKVCVCSPGFAEKDGECKYCDCGKEFNCTFKQGFYDNVWRKTCICPKGYVDFIGVCKAQCSDELPCQNGGECRFKTCYCPYDTKGYLCEELVCTKCVNRLEVDCLYNRNQQTSICSCKNSSLFYDYDASICKPCTCVNGNCEYEINTFSKQLKCRCNPDYKEYKGYCKKCNCGFGGVCDFSFRGEKICHCEEGYYEREGYCLPCNCFGYRDVDTKCEVIDNVKHCLCPEGFHDVLGYCEDINECETNNTCHPSTICYNTFGSFYCQCPDGYEGSLDTKAVPGEVCEDIDECRSHDSCKYYDHVKCVNFPGSYKCECFQGYKPSSYSLDPSKTTCVKAKKSFVPALIVLVVTIVLIAMSIIAHFYVKRRAASLS
ncbi:fibulin-1-like [Argiope bruennichi]|uniref:fibulin-1-like n=1 Tax=Argiope bruennichi TaxID=94029 RepID=UPI0024950E74|nr:fibulin-1-like [Argiope bruennichi]